MLRAVSDVPVVVATARDDDREIVSCLDDGADDYVVKPFSAHQLDARVRAVLRRARANPSDEEVVVGGLVIAPRAHSVVLDGRDLKLTRKEFELLLYLARHVGEVVPKRELLEEVWGLSFGGARTLDVHLSWLRAKLGESATAPVYVHTVRGVGIRLSPPA
jgi:DNA-binding response OmpR family regulator